MPIASFGNHASVDSTSTFEACTNLELQLRNPFRNSHFVYNCTSEKDSIHKHGKYTKIKKKTFRTTCTHILNLMEKTTNITQAGMARHAKEQCWPDNISY